MRTQGRCTHAVQSFIAAVVLTSCLSAAGSAAAGMEFIPSLGITKSTDTNAGDAQGYIGVALRAPLMPFLKLEGGIAYRQDRFADGNLNVRQWPVTASLWACPSPVFYAGGGLGWYRTTFDYASSLPIRDDTRSKVGVHLGGGADFPLSPTLGLDVNGRYIFMQRDDATPEIPTTFNPDFWSLTVGLAFQF